MESDQLSSEDQPFRTHWVSEHRDRFARRQFVRQRRKGLQSNVVGSQRRQALAHFGPQRYHHRAVFLTKQVSDLQGFHFCTQKRGARSSSSTDPTI